MQPAGRLRVETTPGQVSIQAPGELFMIRAIYWSVCFMAMGGGVLSGLSGIADFTALLTVLMVIGVIGGLSLIVWWGLSGLIQTMQSGSRLAGAVLFGLILLTFAPLLLVTGVAPGAGLLIGGFTGVFYFVLLKLFAAPSARVILRQATLEVLHRRDRVVVPLELIGELTPGRPWRSRAMIGPASVPGLGELSAAEWAWLEETVMAAARRRQEALAEEGHDLSASVRPPPALEKLTQR